MHSSLRLQLALFVVALPLNYFWEMAQLPAFASNPPDIWTAALECLRHACVDGLLTLAIYWIGCLTFRQSDWILRPGWRGYLVMLGTGFILTVGVELQGVWLGKWRYGNLMPTAVLFGTEIGLLPILQMLILPPLTAWIVRGYWGRRVAQQRGLPRSWQ